MGLEKKCIALIGQSCFNGDMHLTSAGKKHIATYFLGLSTSLPLSKISGLFVNQKHR